MEVRSRGGGRVGGKRAHATEKQHVRNAITAADNQACMGGHTRMAGGEGKGRGAKRLLSLEWSVRNEEASTAATWASSQGRPYHSRTVEARPAQTETGEAFSMDRCTNLVGNPVASERARERERVADTERACAIEAREGRT